MLEEPSLATPGPAGEQDRVAGDPACRRMLDPPGPERLMDDAAAGHESVARRLADFLFGAQVTAQDQEVDLHPARDGVLEGQFVTSLIRRDPTPITVRLRLRRGHRSWRVACQGSGPPIGPIVEGQFFRIDLAGRVRTIRGFRGVRRQDHLGWAPGPPGRLVELRRALRWIPLFPETVRTLRAALGRLRGGRDLSAIPGVTWRLRRIDPAGRKMELEAYDAGGIYDLHLNGEGATLPPQVPGNYYADAYAAYAFAWLFHRTGRPEYLAACQAALGFVRRVYPQYAPAAIVWHHSDFKGPPFIETVETLLTVPGALDGEARRAAREFIARFSEDRYEPVNVFALRFHGYAARTGAGLGQDEAAMAGCLARLAGEQTSDGLFHDNLPAYPDAHDLTYHQYMLASLAQGLAWKADPRARRLVMRGAEFSLALTSPDGEIAYVGRGANNVYPVASAVLAFEGAGAMAGLDVGVDPGVAGRFRRAARLCRVALERWQGADGMLPTAMNPLVASRTGWHHCETPYNALAAAFLLKASRVADPAVTEGPLPMEVPGYRRVLDDAGFAAVRGQNLYMVVFSGCAQSYPWAGRHRAGLAGLALLGKPGVGALLPVLDQPMPDRAPPMTDLPVLNGAAPYGRGRLRDAAGTAHEVHLAHAYGGVALDRLYLLVDTTLFVVTRIRTPRPGRPLSARGLIGLAARVAHGWAVTVAGDGRVRLTGPGVTVTVTVLHTEPALPVAPRVSPAFTNPRGMAVRVDLVDLRVRRGPEALVACHALQVETAADGQAPAAPSTVTARRLDAGRLALQTADAIATVYLEEPFRVEVVGLAGSLEGPGP